MWGEKKPGEMVTRCLAGEIQMELRIGYADDTYLYLMPPHAVWEQEECWKFRKDTGIEVDEFLGWGIPDERGDIVTGSYLVPETPKAQA